MNKKEIREEKRTLYERRTRMEDLLGQVGDVIKGYDKTYENKIINDEGVVDDAVLQIAVRHHEKLDGTGYHKGLTGADLTLPQQIIAVADILSALYGKRSYKEAFSKEKILDIMNSDADRGKINRNVVTVLERNYDNIIKAFEKEKENTIGLYLKIKEQYEVMIERFKQFD